MSHPAFQLRTVARGFALVAMALALLACSDDDPPSPEGIFGFIDDSGLTGKKEINDLSGFRCDDSGPWLFVPSHADLDSDPPRLWALSFEASTDISGDFTDEALDDLELRLHEDFEVERVEGESGCSIETGSAESWLATGGYISFNDYDRAWFELHFTPEDDDGDGIAVDGCWVVSRDGTDCDSSGIPASSGDEDEDDEEGEEEEGDEEEDA